jgi:hypothetical protein
VTANCTGGDAIYGSRDECSTACGNFPVGSDFATAGDNVQCRTFHGSYPSIDDPATHCGHAAAVSEGNVCADEAPPPTTVTVTGVVHELGGHIADNHVGVVGAGILAYGVSGNIAATTVANGAYTLANVPANGQSILAATKPGYQPTYTAVPIGSTDVTANLLLAQASWLTSVNTTMGVDSTTAFTCTFDATLQCVYALIVGQVLDDGSHDAAGAGVPVTGVSATDFTVVGGPDNVQWHKMGPYFLNANGTVGNNSTSQTKGLYVLYVEIPQTETGYESLHIEITAQTGTGDNAHYYGPTHTAAYRGASTAITWADLRDTGIQPGGGTGGNVSFQGQIYPLFLPTAQGGYGCQGCHTNQGGANPAGGLNLYGGADVAYQALNPTDNPTRVNLANPDQSLLLTKPLYPSTNHPIFAWVSTQDPAYQLILNWIQQGGTYQAAGSRISFVAQVKPLLGNASSAGGIGCVGCHTGGNPANLQFDGTSADIYNNLVTEAAQDGSGSGETTRINKAGHPEKSLLLTNPLQGNTEAHPLKTFASTADPRYQILYRWISEGYQNDGYCEDYCTQIEATCTGTNAQYDTHAHCLSACGAMPRGADTDQAGDTLGCRNYHLTAAAADNSHCVHAGPSGGNYCGAWQEVLCRQHTQSCTGTYSEFASAGACANLMGDVPATGAFGDLSGDTLQCRATHMQVATGDQTHCPHAGFTGDDVCGTWCDTYCRDMQSYCGTQFTSDYTDAAGCQTACSGFAATGNIGDAAGNTVQCRLYHLSAAKADATHCVHAGQASTGVCQ